MPFGIRPFRDREAPGEASNAAWWSPMPFGIRPFRDPARKIGRRPGHWAVSNAFRHSSVSGPGRPGDGGRPPRVSNAFRHSSVSGRGPGRQGRYRPLAVSNAFRHSSVSGRLVGGARRRLHGGVSNAFRHSSVSGPAGSSSSPPGRTSVSNAFRHSSVSGPHGLVRSKAPTPKVSNAFRHSSVSGHYHAYQLLADAIGLQCLSAFVRFGTACRHWKGRCRGVGLQCLSAFVRFGTRPRRGVARRRRRVSPMPFGIRPFRDAGSLYGGDLPDLGVSNAFRHSSVSGPAQAWEAAVEAWAVSNAFRHSSVSGPMRPPSKPVPWHRCLQCLSAFVRFGTGRDEPGGGHHGRLSPMPFGIRPFRDGAAEARAAHSLALSPMPFGIRPFRDRFR